MKVTYKDDNYPVWEPKCNILDMSYLDKQKECKCKHVAMLYGGEDTDNNKSMLTVDMQNQEQYFHLDVFIPEKYEVKNFMEYHYNMPRVHNEIQKRDISLTEIGKDGFDCVITLTNCDVSLLKSITIWLTKDIVASYKFK